MGLIKRLKRPAVWLGWAVLQGAVGAGVGLLMVTLWLRSR